MYLIGSRGLNYQIGVKPKEDADWDLVIEQEKIISSKGIEIAPAELDTISVCKQYHLDKTVDTPVGKANLIHPVGLMLIKRSHLFRTINFPKHIRDYHSLKGQFYDQTDNIYFSLLENRIKLTKEKFGDRTPSLRKTTNQFFNDRVIKYYEHDTIHYATCYGDKPVYEELKSDPDSVWCEKDLWNNLTHEKQINCVREECFTIALERYIIPKIEEGERHPPPKFSFDWALERVCTNLTSGYFRDFAIENWLEIRNHEYDFFGKFNTNSHILKRI